MAKRIRLMLKLPWFASPPKTEEVEAVLVELRAALEGHDEETVRVAVFHLAAETFAHAIWE